VLPPDHPVFDPRLPRFSDLHTGRLIAVDAHWSGVFSQMLDRLKPDIVTLEQPWLFPPLNAGWRSVAKPACRRRQSSIRRKTSNGNSSATRATLVAACGARER
jgi:hypothetical protein